MRSCFRIGAAGLILFLMTGCQGVRFYSQAVVGEYKILAHQKSSEKLMADPATPPKLKAQFEKVRQIRAFAEKELHLPSKGSYVNYTDLGKPYVVWNVNVARVLSLNPKTWWFPVVGRASYRGYFNEKAAHDYAQKWERAGWDVYVDGVDAYSTLGFFRDPLLSTFIYAPEADLAELIFHELAHKRLFVEGDTDFNEAFATEVAAEGLRRWFADSTNHAALERHLMERAHEKQFVQLVMGTRAELEAMYNDMSLSVAQKLERKEEIIGDMDVKYKAVRQTWNGDNGYDGWFEEPINNAKLNTVSAYFEYGPAFYELLIENGRDLEHFYAAAAALGKLPITQRHQKLEAYVKGSVEANQRP